MKRAAIINIEKVIQYHISKKLITGFIKINKNIIKILFTGILLLMLTSCEKDYWGYDGFDGRAYLALSWSDSEPYYIEPGSHAIPNLFYWDEYYRINPGIYTMYYDGEYYDGYGWLEYAWEVDYEIWINYGEEGSLFYDGRDGADNYFVVECNPYGPFVYRDLKSKVVKPEYEVLESSENAISLLMKKEFFSMKVTYRKVEKRAEIQQEVK
jgi:hypothetical protein